MNENFETDGDRKVFAIISIRVGDLLIPGSGGFIEYISCGINERCDDDRYDGGESTYLGMPDAKVGDPDIGELNLGSDIYWGNKSYRNPKWAE